MRTSTLENLRAGRPPDAAAETRGESLGAPIRASAITIPVLRTLSRRFREKKFLASGIAMSPPFAHASRRKIFSSRAGIVSLRENHGGAETLVPC
jgi:hypothetical protein